MALRFLLLTALLALALPAGAAASTASVIAGTLTITAGPRERNDTGIERRSDGYFVQDNDAPVAPGAGCIEGTDMYGNHGALCNGLSSIAVKLRDRDDVLRPIGSLGVPLSYSGGAGTDLIVYLGEAAGFALSNDGVANDGPGGEDNVGPDVEQLFGTTFADTLTAGPRGARLVAGDGDDTLRGGPGDDTLESAYVEDVGVDAGSFYALGTDAVSCGGGEDLVLSDHADTVAGDCEVVAVDNGPRGGFSVRGSAHGDTIGPLPYGWGPATVRAGAGDDTIRTSEVSRAYGDGGNDRIIGFDQAAQAFYGGAGNDRIDVRDSKPAKFNRDAVRCGSGSDLVYADRGDTVARDCERVKRR